MLFNIYINDIFFVTLEINICNSVDDTTPYVCDSYLKSISKKLEQNFELTIAWFEMNHMKFNTEKCYILISRNKNEYMWAILDMIW